MKLRLYLPRQVVADMSFPPPVTPSPLRVAAFLATTKHTKGYFTFRQQFTFHLRVLQRDTEQYWDILLLSMHVLMSKDQVAGSDLRICTVDGKEKALKSHKQFAFIRDRRRKCC